MSRGSPRGLLFYGHLNKFTVTVTVTVTVCASACACVNVCVNMHVYVWESLYLCKLWLCRTVRLYACMHGVLSTICGCAILIISAPVES